MTRQSTRYPKNPPIAIHRAVNGDAIPYPRYGGVGFKELGNLLSGLAMLAHPHRQCFYSLCNQERVHRPKQSAEPALGILDSPDQILPTRHDATHGIAMAADVLRDAVDDQVCAKTGWLKQVRGKPSVVDDYDGARLLCNANQRGCIQHLHGRIDVRFPVNDLRRLRLQRGGELVWIRKVQEFNFNTPRW